MISHPDPFSAFLQTLNNEGYEVDVIRETPEHPVRLKRNGSKDKNGWYYFHLFKTRAGAVIGYGYYGDWRESDSHKEWYSIKEAAR